MGLIKTAIGVGGAYMIVKKLTGAEGVLGPKQNQNQNQGQNQQYTDNGQLQGQGQNRDVSPQRQLQGHQGFCNGSCGGRCMPQQQQDGFPSIVMGANGNNGRPRSIVERLPAYESGYVSEYSDAKTQRN